MDYEHELNDINQKNKFIYQNYNRIVNNPDLEIVKEELTNKSKCEAEIMYTCLHNKEIDEYIIVIHVSSLYEEHHIRFEKIKYVIRYEDLREAIKILDNIQNPDYRLRKYKKALQKAADNTEIFTSKL